MDPTPPDETLRHALRRLGENGARAEQFLDSAAEHLRSDGPLAAQHAAYALREALMSIVALGGARPRGIKEAAEEVVRRWQSDELTDRVTESLRRLRDVLDGPGPNERRLEQAVAGLARVAPTRATADLLDQFVTALDGASSWLHADTPPERAAVSATYEAACAVLRDLFGPISLRLTAMDDLVELRDPEPQHVALLKQRLGDERHLIYLFDRVDGPGWFRALVDDTLLLPAVEGPWAAGPYVAHLAESHPADVRAWLSRLPADLNAKQVSDVVRIARIVKDDVVRIVLRLARKQLDSFDVRFQVDVLLREMSPEQLDSPAVRSLIRWSLVYALGGPRHAMDTYMAAEQLQMAITATAGSQPGAWFTMLAHRAREVAEEANPVRLRLIRPLHELSLNANARPLELISRGVLEAAAASARAGLPVADRLARLQLVPEPLASRLIAQHVLDHLPATAGQAREFIATQIAINNSPSPEELALLRRLFADEVADLEAAVAEALGAAPATPLTLEDPVPDAIIRSHRWLVAIPQPAAPDWHRADLELTERIGVASQDGVMMRVSASRFAGASSPIGLEELAALPPLQAASRVARWRRDPESSLLDPSAEGLAGTLRQAMDADSARWISEDPVELARALRHPVYITALLQHLADHAGDLLGDAERIVALTEFVRSGPWPVEDLGGGLDGPDASWSRAGDEAIKLLGRLGDLDRLRGDASDSAWEQVLGAYQVRNDASPHVEDQERDPLSAAINRPSMRALDAAFSIGQDADHVPDDKLLSLVDEVLSVEGVDGLHSRAMLSRRWPHLRSTAPAWFAEREERIFGDAAPDRLGPATFDLYLQWGDPFGPLLEDERHRVIGALSGERHEEATQHLLHGLLWGRPGFEVTAVAESVIRAGNAAVSYAGSWLGWALADVDELDLAPVTEFWRELLDRDLGPDAYAGFGWMTVNARIDDGEWLGLMAETVTAAAGAVEEPDRVAERAAQTPTDPRAALIIAGLIADDPAPWDLQRIGALGLEVLPAVTDADAAADLRERLLERGFHDAKDA
jgi:hypothetical protein